MLQAHTIQVTEILLQLQLCSSAHLLNLFSQHLPHLPRYARTLFIIQIIALPPAKHSPTLILNLWHSLWPRYDVEMYMRYDLCCSCSVVLDNIVVRHAGYFGDCPGE